jgi:hypothetical protein
MKKIFFLLFLLIYIKGFAQLIPATVGQVYNFSVGDSFEYSYTENQGPCGINGGELRIITSYNLAGDTITYSYISLTSINHAPCPNYNPPYGILFDSSYVTTQVTYADSSIFTVNQSIGVGSCQGFSSSQCYDSTYIAQSGNFTGRTLYEYSSWGFSGTDNIWADSLGLVDSHIGLEDNPPIDRQTDLIYYHKASTGQTWGHFQPFPDYSVYLGVNDLYNTTEVAIYPKTIHPKYFRPVGT